VFVPGLAKGLLPNDRIQHNPAERARSLDFELRGDARILPRYEGNLAVPRPAEGPRLIEERRTAYVALTRAEDARVAGLRTGTTAGRRNRASRRADGLGRTSGRTRGQGPRRPATRAMLGLREQFARLPPRSRRARSVVRPRLARRGVCRHGQPALVTPDARRAPRSGVAAVRRRSPRCEREASEATARRGLSCAPRSRRAA
jgi:hypothetical protein